MNSEVFLLFGVPLTAFSLSIYVTYILGKAGNGMALGVMACLWILVTGGLLVGLEQASGWDGLTYLAALFGLSVPSGLGSLIGGIIGWTKEADENYA